MDTAQGQNRRIKWRVVDNKDSKREKSSEIYTKKEKINIHSLGLYKTLKVKPLRNPGGVHGAASADFAVF